MRKTKHQGPMFEELSDDDEYGDHMSSSNGSSVRYEDPDDHINNYRHYHSSSSNSTRSRTTSNSNNSNNSNTNSNNNDRRRRSEDPFNMMKMSNSFFDNDPFFSNSPFDMMSSMKRSEQLFKRMDEDFNSHFNNINNHSNFDNANSYYSSSFSSISSNRDGSKISKRKEIIKDSRTGTEKVSITKQVGDKKSLLEKTRDKQGKEHVFKKLENVSTDQDFDKEWKQYSKQLPKFKSSSSSSLTHDTCNNTTTSNNNNNRIRGALSYEKRK
ncbi:predicted protein [Naegleria gruberi]|uniref:Predicted protein n=1 Tax=Naegleria gruberi TaxID=5762 RepID=D2W5Q7_NAEGR|nr:uncharacterized protein NAEGRDRAFT_76749 [Naegleria gruberi]EFC35596.1 predicted protein [Naegleria gruberi]|eukprot:XP_002668340.1 predicted protein [Naegleria gruberi strain NEG-M]